MCPPVNYLSWLMPVRSTTHYPLPMQSTGIRLHIVISLLCLLAGSVAAQPKPPFPKTPPVVKANLVAGCGTDNLLKERRLNKVYQAAEDKMNREIAAVMHGGNSLQDN